MGCKIFRNPFLMLMLTLTLLVSGILVGNYLGYARGYRHGQKVTNGWWIDKQSRYYDSVEVEKNRRNQGFNRL